MVVLGTDVFDEFLEQNGLRTTGLNSHDREEIEHRFLRAELSPEVTRDLAALVSVVRHPLAVRSSSLLEDSQYQPFAGIYSTFMLPNDHRRQDVRLRQLLTAPERCFGFRGGRFDRRERGIPLLDAFEHGRRQLTAGECGYVQYTIACEQYSKMASARTRGSKSQQFHVVSCVSGFIALQAVARGETSQAVSDRKRF
ncbi:MAG: hypothetical protein HYU75_17145 [Betaproteobacteria bacterium]|nr:hypothetical protein [Betaproteobacteria bacterium]